MTPLPSVLLVEDEVLLATACKQQLEEQDCRVVIATNADDAVKRAANDDIDVVVADVHLTPDWNSKEGFTLIERLRAGGRQLPVILMTSDLDAKNAMEGMKLGAYDFIYKPPDPYDQAFVQQLRDVIDQAFEASRPVSDPMELGGEAPAKYALVGTSRLMQEVYKQIGKIAPTSFTVLIRGETGTGKELVARAIHRYSDRLSKPFIAVNCAAIAETLMESELFGHERGAFTGADRQRIGRFEQANHGTLFLDEIGDMSFQTQANLLRVLQEKVIQRVGGNENMPIDVRVVAATHHDLERDIREDRFRADLYHRLNKAVIRLPPLRDRQEDIPELVRFFTQRHAAELHWTVPSVTEDAIKFLKEQFWPGNVRDLENFIARSILMSRGRTITHKTILTAIGKADAPRPAPEQTLAAYVRELLDRASSEQLENAEATFTFDTERELYRQAIDRAKGNQVKAARWLGVSRTTMREKLKLYGLHPGGPSDAVWNKSDPDPSSKSI